MTVVPGPFTIPAHQADRAYRGDVADRVRRFLPMVRRLAWHVHGSGRAGIELEDLMQAGIVALTECAQGHAGPGEDGFAAYAKVRVRGAMIDLLRRDQPLLRAAAAKRKRIDERREALRIELGREPAEHELAASLGISGNELVALRDASEPARHVSLDDTYTDRDLHFADERPDSLCQLEQQEMREKLAGALAALPERLQLVVQLYFLEELNLAEIAAVLEVSVPRVHQLKAQAIAQLQQRLSGVMELL